MSVLFCWSLGPDQPVAGLGQSHFWHIFHTDLGQLRALYEVDSPQKICNTTLYYFSVVKIPLGSVTLRWATASSRINT